MRSANITYDIRELIENTKDGRLTHEEALKYIEHLTNTYEFKFDRLITQFEELFKLIHEN